MARRSNQTRPSQEVNASTNVEMNVADSANAQAQRAIQESMQGNIREQIDEQVNRMTGEGGVATEVVHRASQGRSGPTEIADGAVVDANVEGDSTVDSAMND